MRVRCLHGYFIFQEMKQGQIGDFMDYSGLTLVSVKDYFTFETIAEAPDFSLKLKTLFDIPAIANIEGNPWDVFEANELVFDFTKDLVVPIATVTRVVQIAKAGDMFVSNGLIVPGSLTAEGRRVRDYSAWFYRDRLTWHYSELGYV